VGYERRKRGLGVQLHWFLNSALNGGEWTTSGNGSFARNLLNTGFGWPRSRSVFSGEQTSVLFDGRSVLKSTNYSSDKNDVPGTRTLHGAGKMTLTIAFGVTPLHSAHVFWRTRSKDATTCYAEQVSALGCQSVRLIYTYHAYPHAKYIGDNLKPGGVEWAHVTQNVTDYQGLPPLISPNTKPEISPLPQLMKKPPVDEPDMGATSTDTDTDTNTHSTDNNTSLTACNAVFCFLPIILSVNKVKGKCQCLQCACVNSTIPVHEPRNITSSPVGVVSGQGYVRWLLVALCLRVCVNECI
jgi:hypothetical protein